MTPLWILCLGCIAIAAAQIPCPANSNSSAIEGTLDGSPVSLNITVGGPAQYFAVLVPENFTDILYLYVRFTAGQNNDNVNCRAIAYAGVAVCPDCQGSGYETR